MFLKFNFPSVICFGKQSGGFNDHSISVKCPGYQDTVSTDLIGPIPKNFTYNILPIQNHGVEDTEKLCFNLPIEYHLKVLNLM